MTVTIHHNPKCGTSRTVLEMIRAAEHEAEIIEYPKTGWTRATGLLPLAAMVSLTCINASTPAGS